MQGVDLAVMQVDAGAFAGLTRVHHLDIPVLVSQQHGVAISRAVKGGEFILLPQRQQLKLPLCRVQPAHNAVVGRAVQLPIRPPAPK